MSVSVSTREIEPATASVHVPRKSTVVKWVQAVYIFFNFWSRRSFRGMLQGRTKLSRYKNLIFFFVLYLFLSGKLGSIFKVPCSNNFLFWHYCLLVKNSVDHWLKVLLQ